MSGREEIQPKRAQRRPQARPTPRVWLAEAAVQYRERLGNPSVLYEPDYRDRETLLDGLHPERGFATTGELMLLSEVPTA